MSRNRVWVVGNRDRCGRCGVIHGGNDHYCPIHGAVSWGCCKPPCDPDEWVWIGGHPRPERRDKVNLAGMVEEPPYKHQIGHKYVRRYRAAAQEVRPCHTPES